MIPLDQVGFNWRSHKAALAWLWLLYRRPMEFKDAAAGLGRWPGVRVAGTLYLHYLPYLFLVAVMGRLAFEVGVGNVITPGLLFEIARRAVVGIAVGIALGIAYAIRHGIAHGLAFGLAGYIVFCTGNLIGDRIAYGIAFGITAGIAFGMARIAAVRMSMGIAGGIAVVITGGVAYGITGGIAVGIAVGITGGIAGGIAFGITSLRAYYLPLSIPFIWPRVQARWYRYHPVAWDSMSSIPYPELNHLLVAYAEGQPEAGAVEIERIINTYPAQAGEALSAKTILLARQAGRAVRLIDLPGVTAQLPQGKKKYLAQTADVHLGAVEIANLQGRLDTMDRPLFRQPTAELLLKEVQNFGHRMAGFEEPLKTEFRAAAQHWEKLARQQLDQIQAVLGQEPVQQFYRSGDPVDRNREAFVPRNGVTGELEQQIMLSAGCPGIILYGRRRTGKSTVLRNLDGFLPLAVRVAYLSAQSPDLFTSATAFAGAIAKAVRADAVANDLPELFAVLTAENQRLTEAGKRLVLAIDEYEMLDQKIGEGVFPVGMLDTLRESMQTHRAITWILAGSHQITELPHAAWTSYLVSARLIEVPVFTAAETRLLLTSPAKSSTLWPKDSPLRPSFDPSFWGPDGIERIYAETGGWPHLVQLVAETCIDLLNDEGQPVVNPALLERAMAKSVVRGEAVFYELLRRESTLAGEWEYLEGFKSAEWQALPADAAVVRSLLRRRELVVADGDRWRLRVPLMRRWLVERG